MAYTELQDLKVPDEEDAIIWRYMDLSKLLFLLENEKLHFHRADSFQDPFEGALPYIGEKTNVEVEKVTKENNDWPLEDFPYEIYNKFIYLNCWHINERQSAAMWDIYRKSDYGIAIQSTFKKLKNCLDITNKDVTIGKVEYMRPEQLSPPEENAFEMFVYKRPSFKHEQELRALYADKETAVRYLKKVRELEDEEINSHADFFVSQMDPDIGKNIVIRAESLIETIYLDPTASSWIYNLLCDIVKRFGFDIEVAQSDLYDEPQSVY